jgi:hypothetical protein
MTLRVELRLGIPTAERGVFRRPLRRTTLLRVVLGLSLLASLFSAFVLARSADVRTAPLLPSDTTPVLVLDLSASISNFPRVADTLRRVAGEEEQAGLVVFSSGAYELLPPGTPARELESFVRFFTPLRKGGDVYPRNPWDAARFRGGTSIPSGLEAGQYALLRAGVKRGSLLLLSDLDASSEPQRLSDVIVALRQDGIQLRIVPLDPTPEHRAFFERIVGRAALLAETRSDAPVQAPAERRTGGALPWAFLLVAGLLAVLLATNERLLARLELRP